MLQNDQVCVCLLGGRWRPGIQACISETDTSDFLQALQDATVESQSHPGSPQNQ